MSGHFVPTPRELDALVERSRSANANHGPAHRGGRSGVFGVDYVYTTPGEADRARADSLRVSELTAQLAHYNSVVDGCIALLDTP